MTLGFCILIALAWMRAFLQLAAFESDAPPCSRCGGCEPSCAQCQGTITCS